MVVDKKERSMVDENASAIRGEANELLKSSLRGIKTQVNAKSINISDKNKHQFVKLLQTMWMLEDERENSRQDVLNYLKEKLRSLDATSILFFGIDDK